MDVEDIPDIDPAVPAEPDFFGEDGAGILSLSSDSINPTPLPPENILDGLPLPTSELKYDDEMCEFDEFLVGIEALAPNKNGDNASMEQDQPQEVAKEDEDQPTELLTSEDKEDPQEDADNDNDNDAKPDGSTVSSSAPNTPDSRGSAIVRLALPIVPKINIIGRASPRRKNNNVVNELSLSPTRTLRGRVNENTKKETRAKRKISDDEFEPDDESFEENTPKKSSNVTRSGRSTRRSARRGQSQDDSDDDEIGATAKGKTRSGRSARKIARYGFEDDSDEKNESENEEEQVDSAGEELFQPVKKKKRSEGSNYTTQKNGNIFFTDSSGNVTKIKPASVALIRLSESEISKLLLGEEDSLEDEDDDNPFLLEVCIDNFHSAVEAVKGGAKRIELCSSLAEGGLTPTGGFLTLVKEKFKDIPVFVMIRPRGGDFVYTPEEVEIMSRDISHYKQMGADGFVFGILTKDCDVDKENCKLLKQMAYPLECTFHRAFDKASNPFSALETIISLGFSRILTSGQSTTAYAGLNVIKRLVEEAGSRITILAGAGINHTNVGDIVRRTGVKEVHGSASKSVASKMTAPGPSKSNKRGHKPSCVKMGSTDDSIIKVTDSNLVALIVRKGRKNVRR